MKQIPKFRVWTGNKMEYNVLVGALGVFYCPGLDEEYPLSVSRSNIRIKDLHPDKLMQWLGFRDRVGREIYTGDIVRNKSGCKDVIEIVTLSYSPFLTNGGAAPYVTCIGNVFENPELLL